MITGTLIQNATDGFDAHVHSLTFDIALTMRPNTGKSGKTQPDYLVFTKSVSGRELRVGAMWNAKGQKSGTPYFSIRITGKTGRTYFMNAFADEDLHGASWTILPLLSKEVTPVFVQGDLEMLDDGGLVGSIASHDFDLDVTLLEVPHDPAKNQPAYRIMGRSPQGVPVQIGSAWNAVSEASGNPYISLKFTSPQGTAHRANAVMGPNTPEGYFDILPFADQPQDKASADAFDGTFA